MAKPGSSCARQISAGVPDLGALKPVPADVAEEAQKKAELQLHMRCTGCGERIGMGFLIHKLTVIPGPDQRPAANRMKVAACNGANGCEFAKEAADGATVMELIEYVWVDEEGQAPASRDEPDRPEPVIHDPAEDMIAEGSPVAPAEASATASG